MILSKIKKVLFDTSCLLCNKRKLSRELDLICDDCFKIFNMDIDNICLVCGHPLNKNGKCESCSKLGKIYFDTFKFIQYYTGYFKKIIAQLKLNDNYMINIIFFKLLIIKKMIKKDGVITVVPDNFYKRIKRGRSSIYYVLKLFKKNNFKIIKSIYKRKNIIFYKKKSQKTRNELQRINWINNLYYLPEKNKKTYSGRVYLIDDLYTTGATINYGAKLLKEAGFNEVHVISFFRARLNSI